MFLVSINIIFILVLYDCKAADVDSDIKNYYSGNKQFQNIWRKYKRGIETSLEQMLQENYDGIGMNVYLRRSTDNFKLTEGFLEDSDPVVEVLFRDLYLMELPKMRYPKVSFPLASNLIKIDSELSRVKVFAKYMVYRNDSVLVFANGKESMLKVSPFSLEQVQTIGEVTIIGDECRLTGHAIATLSDQSVNLGHNTFALSDCKLSLEIWTPGQGSPPVFAPYFSACDGGFIQNLISKPLQEELMSKLQGGMFSFLNTSEIFGDNLPKIRKRQQDLFKKVNNHLTETVNNLDVLTTNKNQGVAKLDSKTYKWTVKIDGVNINNLVSLNDISLYGLDTAYAAQNGGPFETNGTSNVEVPIGFTSLQIRGKISYGATDDKSSKRVPTTFKFSAELQDFAVVINLGVENGLKAASFPSRGKQAWYSPQIRTFELNHYDVTSIWSRSLITAHLTNEVYTAVVKSLLAGQLNDALQKTSKGATENIRIPEEASSNEEDNQKSKDKLKKLGDESDNENPEDADGKAGGKSGGDGEADEKDVLAAGGLIENEIDAE